MTGAKPEKTPMCPGTKLSLVSDTLLANPKLYRSVIGALQYLTMTRPDKAFVVNRLNQFLKALTTSHYSTCKRVLRYLVGTPTLGICFKAAPTLDLQGFTDADWASNVDDRKSTSVYCVFLGGNLISWCSKKQQVIARSSTKFEYRSLALATAELFWIQLFLTELTFPVSGCLILWCDNMGARPLAPNPVFHSQTKHIEIYLHFVRDRVLAQQLDVRYVDSAHQISDLITKALCLPKKRLLMTW
ncbi:secreted RxLR effector protein 161-like [Humulus lupulus]|uniref:secreted RxLR effector protein 161-like n=1 Tax=Humulus lupulus TaxID=3486 RepID=UPI002B4073EC|nr:secreted RxLR effector protein 161-like [Humulus lupulus]